MKREKVEVTCMDSSSRGRGLEMRAKEKRTSKLLTLTSMRPRSQPPLLRPAKALYLQEGIQRPTLHLGITTGISAHRQASSQPPITS
jgi:hypothetical protein